jgi:hypothetical protein
MREIILLGLGVGWDKGRLRSYPACLVYTYASFHSFYCVAGGSIVGKYLGN